ETGAGQPRTVAGFFRASAFFRAVLAMMAVIGLVIPGTLQVALPVLTRRTAGLGVTGYGFLVTALGIGMVLGGLSAGRLGSRPHQGRLVIGLLAVHAGLLAAVPAWPGLAGKLAGMALLGAADGALGVIVITVLQRMPPPYLRGRVLAALAFVNFAAYPLSVLVAGQLVGHAGPAAMFWVAGAGIAGVALIGLASAAVRDA
ncbi:MAG TPA: hypothetical protein VHA75_11920, partial [Rugosimonospora sp.]|nr:hypothetical protein [Rugosimonospora sp.]